MRNQFAHFRDGNCRQSSNKEEQQRHEKAHRADKGAVVPERRLIAAPGAGNEIARQTDNYDDETLEPHTQVDDERHDEKCSYIRAHFANPEKLRRQDIAQNQSKIITAVRPMQTLLHQENVKLVAAVERQEKLHEVAVRDDEACGE